jgi:hypothetical protein
MGWGMKQLTLATVGFERYAKPTRRAAFLAEMERVVPWSAHLQGQSGGREASRARIGCALCARRLCPKRSLPGNENRTTSVAHDPCCIGAKRVILRGRPMRSDDNEIGLGSLGDPQNLGIDAGAMCDRDIGFKVGRIDAPDQGGNAVFQVREDDLITEGRRLCLKNGLDLAHDGEDMKLAAEDAARARPQRAAACLRHARPR